MNHSELAQSIRQVALDCGFDNCGIIPVANMDGFLEHYRQRMKTVPASAVFYKVVGDLAHVQKRFPWASSVVVCTYDYSKFRYPEQMRGRYAKAYFLSPEPGSTEGYDLKKLENWFSAQGIRFAGGEDFSHESIGSLRHAGEMAGLGIVRKNNFFYTENGSYVLLFGYVIDTACSLIHENNLKPCAESCTLCKDACKTKSLSGPHTMNPLKCVSFWTTFGKGVIPPGLKEDMFEEWLCGCDNCQDACPHNRKVNWADGEDFANLKEIASMLTPEKVLEASDAFLAEQVLPKTMDHMRPGDESVLRKNAKRAIRYLQKTEEETV